MNIDQNNACCTVKKITQDKNSMKFMYPSLSQELFDTLSPNLKLCTKIYMDCYKKKKIIH